MTKSKRIPTLLLATLLAVALVLSLSGCGILDLDSGLYFIASADSSECTVYDYSTWLEGEELEIPPLYRDRPVTAIGDGALMFAGYRTVTIPAGVTFIGCEAFYGCDEFGLTEVFFAEPEGWYILELELAIPPDMLSDPATAARHLTGDLCPYTLVRIPPRS